MKLTLTLTLTLAAFLGASCGDKDVTKRNQTDIDIPEMGAPISANAPSGLKLIATDNSPQICSSDSCPTVAATVKSRLFASDGGSIIQLVAAADGRIEELKTRSAGSNVPCFEETGVEKTITYSASHSFSYTPKCYDNYEGTSGVADAGQMLFGKTDTNVYFVGDRYYESDTNVRTMWATQDEDENVELWHASFDEVNDNGSVLTHLKSTKATGVVEFTRAGVGSVSGGVDFMCGSQIRLNSSYVYISGQIAAPSTTSSKSCSDVASVTYCLNTTDFSEESESKCVTAGLTTFELTAITTSDIDTSTFFSKTNINHSSEISAYSTLPLEEEN